MKFVGSGTHGEVHYSKPSSEFGRVERILDFELFDSFVGRARLGDETGSADVLHVDTVDEDLLAETGSAVDGFVPLRSGHAGGEKHEVLNLAPAGGSSRGRPAHG